ncbi:hypothetical protein MHYP_G00053420 [Metynnis hypsauchen]
MEPSPSTSQPSNTQNLPITQQDHPEPPSETPRTPPKKVRNPTAEETAEQHSSRPCTGKDIDVAVLIDSNGKFLQEDKLFPGQTTSKIWCPKIRDAHRIISDPNLGTPKYIIIHTGTNDLRLEQERVGGLVCRVAERAAESFPNAKIIISTLLPRKDFHPATIQRVNADISRGCALLPNVHLAHHSTITPYHLYDHVHLNKHMIKEFARTLKDVAQGRHSYSVQQHRAESLKPQHHHHRYTAISPVVYKHYLRPRHLPGQRSPPQPTLRAPPTGPVHPATPSRPALRPHLTTSACNILSSGLAQRPPPTRLAHQHQSGPTPRAAPLSQVSVLQQQRSYAEALQTPQNSTQMGEIKQLLQYICTKLT